MNLSQVLDHVNAALKEPFDWSEIDAAIIELHSKLTEPKWAIEDEALREECEKLLVQMTVQRYLND